jgi:hypothetical protein
MVERNPRLSAVKLTWLTSRSYLGWFLFGLASACFTVVVLDGSLPFTLAIVPIGVIVLGMLLSDRDVGLFYQTDPRSFGLDGWMVAVVDPPIRWASILAIFLGAVPWLSLMFVALLTAPYGHDDETKARL